MRNKSRGELLNEAVLIQNIIDYMLGRIDYTGALRSEFDFTSKTAVLQYLAFHFKEKGEVQKKNNVIKYVVELLKRKALDYDAADIVTGFIECGIMVKMSDEISFRYKRFQEFFVAGYIRDNVESLVEIKRGDNWIGYARDLDIYTSRFRHEHSLLEFAKSTLKSIDIPDPALSLAEAKDYLAAGLDPTFTLIQLRRMRKQKMTASGIDSLMDITDQRLVQKRQMEVRQQSTTGVAAPSTLYMRFYLALEMYSQFVRNLEFVDRDIKRSHLLESLAGWEKSLRGTLSTVKQGMDELKEDIPKSGLITAEFTEEKIKELIWFIESYFKE
jgi:hypothetical protein